MTLLFLLIIVGFLIGYHSADRVIHYNEAARMAVELERPQAVVNE